MSARLLFIVCAALYLIALGKVVYADSILQDETKKQPKVTIVALNQEKRSSGVNINNQRMTFSFWVESDTNKLNFYCTATMLWKEGLPKIDDNSLLAVEKKSGCDLEFSSAVSLAGTNTARLKFLDEKYLVRGFSAAKSDYATFETVSGESFKQDVYVTVRWKQKEELIPAGSYEAYVELHASVPKAGQRSR